MTDYTMSIEPHQIPPLWELPIPVEYVVDVGCNEGVTTEHYAKMFPKAHILGIELDQEVARRAATRVKDYSNVHIFAQAIGWPEGIATAYIDYTSTVSTLTPYQSRGTSAVQVDVKSLDSVLDMFDISRVDFMKIDIEGAEMMLLESTNWLKVTKAFLVECHSEEAIQRYKNLEGFRVRPLLDDPLWGNHLFARQI